MEGKMIAGMYDLEETLGSGHFAVVKLARHVITGDHVAVKVIDKTKLDQTARDHLFQEVRCMKLVQHPSVIRLYQVIDTQSKLYLILELGENGDLYEYISKHSGGVGEDESRDLFRQIVEAISYCHRLHVVHRDLKPENVVFCQNAARVKLTDFGLSNLFAPGELLKTSCGSLSYAAPEILLGDMYDAPAVDLWSLGVILYMLLVGEKPFVGGTDSETLTMIMDCKFDMPAHLSSESVDLVKKLLVSDPKQRISLDEIFRHPWMQRCPSSSKVHLPTVRRSELDADERRDVIQKMVDRGVADVDAIHRSLDSNAYDHIAATYYLMAEAQQRDKDDVDTNPVSDIDLQRLDRRRQRVRKLSTPGSPLRTTGTGDANVFLPSLENAHHLQTNATPTKPRSVPRPMPASHMDTFELGPIAASSPGRGMRRGAAETGVLRPVRRSPFSVQSVSSPLNGTLVPGSPATPIGGSLRRSSVTCKLNGARSEENFGIGSLQFSLPILTANNELTPTAAPVTSPEEEVSTSAETTPVSSTGVTPQRSLVLIEESETVDEGSDSEAREAGAR